MFALFGKEIEIVGKVFVYLHIVNCKVLDTCKYLSDLHPAKVHSGYKSMETMGLGNVKTRLQAVEETE